MIKYDYTVTVTGNTAKLDKDIYLFRGNKNVHYYFAIKNASFNFKGTTDLIEKTNAINAAVTVVKPNAVEVANAIAPVENGLIHLKVTEDLIDEEVEVGDFDLVFDLFDDTDGAVTIPKVIGQFHVLERPCTTPISELAVATNTTNEVDYALTDYAITTYAEPVASTNADGTFAKKTWVAKEKITTAELNRMEEGIAYNNSQYKDIANLSLVKGTDGKVYIKKQDGTLLGDGIEIGGSDVDLSKITMSMSGQTLKLMNDGTQIATVEIPTATVTDEQLTSIIQAKIDDGTLTSLTLGENSVSTTNVQDEAITPNKTNFFKEEYKNIAYGTTYTKIDWSKCDDGDNLGYDATYSDYINVNGTTIYTRSMISKYKGGSNYTIIVGCYDSNKNFLEKLTYDEISSKSVTINNTTYYQWYEKFTLVENTVFIKVGVQNGFISTIEGKDIMDGLIISYNSITEEQLDNDLNFEVVDKYFSLIHNAITPNKSLTNDKFKELFTPNLTNFLIERDLNLIDSDKSQTSVFFNSATTDSIGNFNATNITDYIPVEYGKTYYSYNDGYYSDKYSKLVVRGYDENKNYLGVCYGEVTADTLLSQDNGITQFTVDRTDLKYIRFQYRNDNGNHILSEYDDKKYYDYDSYKILKLADKYKFMFVRCLFEDEGKSELTTAVNKVCLDLNTRPLYDKKWVQIGDSLTNWNGGGNEGTGFMGFVHNKEGIICYNQGYAGACWELTTIDGETVTSEPDSDKYSAVRRVEALITNKDTFTPDIITIMMGTNRHNEGDITDESSNLYTMCGAIRYCLENLLRTFPTVPIGIILPPQRLEGIVQQESRNEKIKTIANYYSIPVLDTFHEGQIVGATRVPVDGHPNSGNGSLTDGTHLGDVGITNLGRKLCNWLKTL